MHHGEDPQAIDFRRVSIENMERKSLQSVNPDSIPDRLIPFRRFKNRRDGVFDRINELDPRLQETCGLP